MSGHLFLVRFGKHAGKPWAEVPRDYLAWMLRTGGFDPDVTHTARHFFHGIDP